MENPKRRKIPKAKRRRLCLEPLEARMVLSAMNVFGSALDSVPHGHRPVEQHVDRDSFDHSIEVKIAAARHQAPQTGGPMGQAGHNDTITRNAFHDRTGLSNTNGPPQEEPPPRLDAHFHSNLPTRAFDRDTPASLSLPPVPSTIVPGTFDALSVPVSPSDDISASPSDSLSSRTMSTVSIQWGTDTSFKYLSVSSSGLFGWQPVEATAADSLPSRAPDRPVESMPVSSDSFALGQTSLLLESNVPADNQGGYGSLGTHIDGGHLDPVRIPLESFSSWTVSNSDVIALEEFDGSTDPTTFEFIPVSFASIGASEYTSDELDTWNIADGARPAYAWFANGDRLATSPWQSSRDRDALIENGTRVSSNTGSRILEETLADTSLTDLNDFSEGGFVELDTNVAHEEKVAPHERTSSSMESPAWWQEDTVRATDAFWLDFSGDMESRMAESRLATDTTGQEAQVTSDGKITSRSNHAGNETEEGGMIAFVAAADFHHANTGNSRIGGTEGLRPRSRAVKMDNGIGLYGVFEVATLSQLFAEERNLTVRGSADPHANTAAEVNLDMPTEKQSAAAANNRNLSDTTGSDTNVEAAHVGVAPTVLIAAGLLLQYKRKQVSKPQNTTTPIV